MATEELDVAARKFIEKFGARPAFLGYQGFPAAVCVSVNEELVHGIPRKDKIIRSGDIVSIDLGVEFNGFYGDVADTFALEPVSKEKERLIDTAHRAMTAAVKKCRVGKRIGDVSAVIQQAIEENGFQAVREYVGHGIGRNLHEDPAVPNFGSPGTGVKLESGMVLCLEPMINAGTWQTKVLTNGWTVVTADGRMCAHYEQMVAIGSDGPEVLTKI
jgi:methionyl aminopeptidase